MGLHLFLPISCKGTERKLCLKMLPNRRTVVNAVSAADGQSVASCAQLTDSLWRHVRSWRAVCGVMCAADGWSVASCVQLTDGLWRHVRSWRMVCGVMCAADGWSVTSYVQLLTTFAYICISLEDIAFANRHIFASSFKLGQHTFDFYADDTCM